MAGVCISVEWTEDKTKTLGENALIHLVFNVDMNQREKSEKYVFLQNKRN